jgi:hypothetical protein
MGGGSGECRMAMARLLPGGKGQAVAGAHVLLCWSTAVTCTRVQCGGKLVAGVARHLHLCSTRLTHLTSRE